MNMASGQPFSIGPSVAFIRTPKYSKDDAIFHELALFDMAFSILCYPQNSSKAIRKG